MPSPMLRNVLDHLADGGVDMFDVVAKLMAASPFPRATVAPAREALQGGRGVRRAGADAGAMRGLFHHWSS